MKLFALIAVVVYCAVSLFMAVRLLLLARRTRELPELMIGLAFMTGGMLGYPFSVAARILAEASKPEAAYVAYVTGHVGMALAAFFLLLSWHRIFSPNSRKALAFVVGWSAFMIVPLVAVIRANEPGTLAYLGTLTYWTLLVSQGGCYAILGVSSFQHGRTLERRATIGLANPVVANRLILWGMSNTAITISYLYVFTAGVMLRNSAPNIYDPSIVVGLGMTSAFFVTLAFFPPRAYTERIRAKSAMDEA